MKLGTAHPAETLVRVSQPRGFGGPLVPVWMKYFPCSWATLDERYFGRGARAQRDVK